MFPSSRGSYSQQHSWNKDCRNLNQKLPSRTEKKSIVIEKDSQFEELTKALELAKGSITYKNWKTVFKQSPSLENTSITKQLWRNALELLDDNYHILKHEVPGDLESSHGQQHITVTLGIQDYLMGSMNYIEFISNFLKVLTHEALLKCLLVNTAVNNIFNYIIDNKFTSFLAFIQRICSNLYTVLNGQLVLKDLDVIMIAITKLLLEIFKRQQLPSMNEILPQLITVIEDILKISGFNEKSMAHQFITDRNKELRRIADRVSLHLKVSNEHQILKDLSKSFNSTSNEDIMEPRNLHDNDKSNISEIQIIPTLGEIKCKYPEYLPSTDFDQPHFLGEKRLRHLDTHFRILRYNNFGSLKEVLRDFIETAEKDQSIFKKSQLNLSDQISLNTYPDAKIKQIRFNKRRGIEVYISFPQPLIVRYKSVRKREYWWNESKRLEPGVLLCFLSFRDGRCHALFLSVSEKITDKAKIGLVSHEYFGTISANLSPDNESTFEELMKLSIPNPGYSVLLEASNFLLGTKIPVLQGLQKMFKSNFLPFQQWILPEKLESSAPMIQSGIPPPKYALRNNFFFSLKSILKSPNEHDILLDPKTALDNEELINSILKNAHLDHGQAKALVWALCQEFVQIQGPPGTGKSYLGVKIVQVLLDVARLNNNVDLGPIIVVCYTNHALDQFLEHLIDKGVKNIFRVGGQSKSEAIKDINLNAAISAETVNLSERSMRFLHLNNLDSYSRSIIEKLKVLQKIRFGINWSNTEEFLKQHYPQVYKQFSRDDKDSFTLVGQHPFDKWLPKKQKYMNYINSLEHKKTAGELLNQIGEDIFCATEDVKLKLVSLWISEIRKKLADSLNRDIKEVEKLREGLNDVYSQISCRVLQRASVIGVTTSGIAGRFSTFRQLNAKVMVCEEAGEITEPHLLTTLIPTVEHFISIGDHMQLRPRIENFKLSLENPEGTRYQLDRSLFERLSIGETGRLKFPVSQLTIQRRMRPEISSLIKGLYTDLKDDESVKNLPDVVGLRKNVFFLDHNNPEDLEERGFNKQKSYSNLWEVKMIHALVRHLIRQGEYSSSDIAVLTPYKGQLQNLHTSFQEDFKVILSEQDQDLLVPKKFLYDDSQSEDNSESDDISKIEKIVEESSKDKICDYLRLATVDNFQGEEAKVVIVSLVRSNDQKKVGFLRTENRINVLLSRAKHGLYLIGNAENYSEVPMWAKVLNILRAQNSVGPSLELCCPRHKSTVIQVSCPADFENLSPEGGCQQVCGRNLDCGHQCIASCHSEFMHTSFVCPEPCQRFHDPCKHKCQKKTCGEPCDKCRLKFDITLPCVHTKEKIECFSVQCPENIFCSVLVKKKLPNCEHSIEVPCSSNILSLSPENIKCSVLVKKKLPNCEHSIEVPCSSNILSLSPENIKCSVLVKKKISECGHTKEVPCYENIALGQESKNFKCTTLVEKYLSECGHIIEVPCFQKVSSPFYGCNKPCKVHSLGDDICPGECGDCQSKNVKTNDSLFSTLMSRLNQLKL